MGFGRALRQTIQKNREKIRANKATLIKRASTCTDRMAKDTCADADMASVMAFLSV